MRKRMLRDNSPPELDITAFLNLMVVLVPFLLITAVFSRITILELNLPNENAASNAEQDDEEKVVIEVIVRKNKLEIGDGQQVIATFNNRDIDDGYDMQALSEYLLALKQKHPEKEDAIVLMEADVSYEILVHTMDAIRSAEIIATDDATSPIEQAAEKQKIVLFPTISVGDAPIVDDASKGS